MAMTALTRQFGWLSLGLLAFGLIAIQNAAVAAERVGVRGGFRLRTQNLPSP